MKFALLFLMISLSACFSGKKAFLCGDRECVNNKERDQYFAEKFIIEIRNKDKITESIDLVKLNEKKKIKRKNIFFKDNIKVLTKKEKKNIIKKVDNKKKIVKKLKKKNKIRKNLKKSQPKKTSSILTPTKKEVKKSKLKNNNIVSNKTIKDCKNIEDCDITAIETNLMKAGSDKDFPNISSN